MWLAGLPLGSTGATAINTGTPHLRNSQTQMPTQLVGAKLHPLPYGAGPHPSPHFCIGAGPHPLPSPLDWAGAWPCPLLPCRARLGWAMSPSLPTGSSWTRPFPLSLQGQATSPSLPLGLGWGVAMPLHPPPQGTGPCPLPSLGSCGRAWPHPFLLFVAGSSSFPCRVKLGTACLLPSSAQPDGGHHTFLGSGSGTLTGFCQSGLLGKRLGTTDLVG